MKALRTKENDRESNHEKLHKTQHGIPHRLIRRTALNSVGSTDETELSAKKRHTLVKLVQTKLYPSVDLISTG